MCIRDRNRLAWVSVINLPNWKDLSFFQYDMLYFLHFTLTQKNKIITCSKSFKSTVFVQNPDLLIYCNYFCLYSYCSCLNWLIYFSKSRTPHQHELVNTHKNYYLTKYLLLKLELYCIFQWQIQSYATWCKGNLKGHMLKTFVKETKETCTHIL